MVLNVIRELLSGSGKCAVETLRSFSVLYNREKKRFTCISVDD